LGIGGDFLAEVARLVDLAAAVFFATGFFTGFLVLIVFSP
jgi:hypothetical protein